MADRQLYDGDAVPKAVEYLARLAIRWSLYSLSAVAIIAAVVLLLSGQQVFAGVCAVVGCTLAIAGWKCTPKRNRAAP
jgi:predicted anti-sigma-YlaC factor YlaD